jgi:hypothetical protein
MSIDAKLDLSLYKPISRATFNYGSEIWNLNFKETQKLEISQVPL